MRLKIEKIEQAAEKLRAAIYDRSGPTRMPDTLDAEREAVIAIIKAVANELSVDLVVGDCGE